MTTTRNNHVVAAISLVVVVRTVSVCLLCFCSNEKERTTQPLFCFRVPLLARRLLIVLVVFVVVKSSHRKYIYMTSIYFLLFCFVFELIELN